MRRYAGLSVLFVILVSLAGVCQHEDIAVNQKIESCTIVCEKVVNCTAEQFAPGAETPGSCEWTDADEMQAVCVKACNGISGSEAVTACLECISTNFACSGSAAFRPCDGTCAGTDLITGTDFEGAAEYAYEQWFFDDYADAVLWTCPGT